MRMMMNCHYHCHQHDTNDDCSNKNKKHIYGHDTTKKKKKKTNCIHEAHGQRFCGYDFSCSKDNVTNSSSSRKEQTTTSNHNNDDEPQMMLVEQLLAIQQLEATHYYKPLLCCSNQEEDQTFRLLSAAERDDRIHVIDYNKEEEQRCIMFDRKESSSSPVLYNAMSCGVYSLMGNCHTADVDGREDEDWRTSTEPNDEEKDESLVHPDQRMSGREQPWYGYDRTSFTSTTTTTSSTIAATTTPYVRQGPACARGFLSTLEKYWHMAVRKGLCYTNTIVATSRTVEKETRDVPITTAMDTSITHYDETTLHLEDVNVSLSSSMRSLSYSQSGHCHDVTMMNNDDDQVEVWLLDEDLPRQGDPMVGQPHNNGGCADHCGCDDCEDETMMNDDMPPPVRLSLDDITTPDISIWRPRIAEWIYKVLDHFEVDREVAYVALWYLDRFVARCCLETTTMTQENKRRRTGSLTVGQLEPFSLEWYQCASMACVALASKLWAIRDPHDVLTITDLLKLSRQGSLSFGRKDVCQMEVNVLHTLEWHVHPPTSCNVVSLLVRLLGNRPLVVVTEDVLQLAYFLTELATLQQEFMATYDATTTAWAALAVSFEEHSSQVSAATSITPLLETLTRHGIVVGMHHIRSAQAELKRLYNDHLSAAASASNLNDVDPLPNTTTPTPRPNTPKKRPVMVVSPKGVASTNSSSCTEDNATVHNRNATPSRVVWGRPRSLGTGTFV